METGQFPDVLESGDCYLESKYNSAYGADAVVGYNNMYCEMKTLLPSKSFMLGATVRLPAGSGNPAEGDLSLHLSNLDYTNYASCSLQQLVSEEYSLFRCAVNFSLTQPTRLFVCISNSGLASYQIKAETAEEVCGFSGQPSSGKNFVADYALYAKPANFAPFNYSIRLDKNSFQIADLVGYLDNYIQRKFGRDCSKEGGCIIPIKIISSESVTISNLKLGHSNNAGNWEIGKFYTAKPADITMSATAVDLKGLNLKAPSENGIYTLQLKINGNVLGTADFSVSPALLVPIISSVEPRNVSVNALTKFTTVASSPKGNKIVNYTWNFGDNTSSVVTAANNASHTYVKSGVYSLIIKAKDNESLEGEETFTIRVGALSPQESLNATLGEKKAALSSIQSEIEEMPWYSSKVKELLNIGDIGLNIDSIEEKLIAGVMQNKTDDYFTDLKSELDQQIVPLSIEDTLIFDGVEALLDVGKINPDYIKALGETYEPELREKIKNAIGWWQSENLDIILSGKTLLASYDDDSSKDIITILDIELKPKDQELKNVYFVVELPSGVSYNDVEFAENYGQKSISAAIGFMFRTIANTGETISIALPGRQDSLIMNMFASATFDELTLEERPVTCGNQICEKDKGENYKNCSEDCKPTKRIIAYLLLVLVSSGAGIFLIWRFYVAIYDLMQQRKLFKTRKNYTDLLIFISNSLKRSVTEKEITENLIKSGWNMKQIKYAMLKAKKARKKIIKEQE